MTLASFQAAPSRGRKTIQIGLGYDLIPQFRGSTSFGRKTIQIGLGYDKPPVEELFAIWSQDHPNRFGL